MCRNGPRKGKQKKEEQAISLGPQEAEGETVTGVCHTRTSFSDTPADLFGQRTICWVIGGLKMKAD